MMLETTRDCEPQENKKLMTISSVKKDLPVEETLFRLLGEEQRNLHECLCHWLSKFYKNNLLAVCWGFPALLGGRHPSALAAN